MRRTLDDVYIAYRAVGDGPLDLVWQTHIFIAGSLTRRTPPGHRPVSTLFHSQEKSDQLPRRAARWASKRSFEKRMGNISAVRQEMGLPIIAGYKPKEAGTNPLLRLRAEIVPRIEEHRNEAPLASLRRLASVRRFKIRRLEKMRLLQPLVVISRPPAG